MGGIASGGTSRQATTQDLELYERMRQQQAQQPVPLLHSRRNPHEYLFFALFDGTGQDVNDPKQLPTNIGELWKQVYEPNRDPTNPIGAHYEAGIGTQKNPITRAVDGAAAYTWGDKIEEMYRALAEQVNKWQQQDPQAQIRLAEIGYSRGAVLVPGLARLVDEYGIVHPDQLKFGRDAHGNLTVNSPRPPLIPPGQVAQAVGLFDPVATNMPENYDARLPPSVVSGFSLIARDEQRELFPHQTILDPQRSADGRFLNMPVPGGHSNVGGGNRASGLETLAFNGMADYLNALSDRPLFEHRPVPSDPAQYTIHQTQGATAVWRIRMDHDGQRNLRSELANCKIVDPCRDAEPIDLQLAQQFQWHHVEPLAIEHLPALPQAISHREAPAIPEPYRASDMPNQDSDRARTPQAWSVPSTGKLAPPTYLDPAHPHHPLFRELREKLPTDVSNEKVAEFTLAAREGGVRPGRVESVHVHDGKAWVLGTIPGFDGMVDLRTPAPPLTETMQKADAFEQQHQAQVAQWQEQRQQSQSHGRSM